MSGIYRGYEKPAGAAVTRIGVDPGEEGTAARAILETGCTLTEILSLKGKGPKVARFLYGPKDDPAKAIGILKGLGYNVDVMTRQRP